MERTRLAGVVLAVSAVAKIALFLAHPAGHAAEFTGFIKDEAANQVMDTAVHGGLAVILVIQLAIYAILSGRIGWQRPLVVAGLAIFAVGALIQIASVLTAGVLTPALAARYSSEPADRIAAARDLFVLCDVAATMLTLWGMLFEAAGITAWGAELVRISRLGGFLTLVVGIAMLAALMTGAVLGKQFGMTAVLGLTVWPVIAAVLMIRRVI